ncbi:MAG TPA: 30S ribosomal protein S13 [Caldisericia bacterium]|jgi:small subunit ribosomal protein S13|nr:30S ribosomal protein S13 [Caldisericia bacterium]MCE5176440.1 30S ribosomal protein S13 [bacterium]HNY61238.1 30S ribosomal protein S13 [Caldisericia bacterium]HOC78829.1 30S ribosomal protein S13 [Caldisericia bacterium]HOG70347.1 30S ribosomal protein S13 [Caldisericia bacterium]
MPRISGIDIPAGKRVDISLRYIYGIGPKNALEIVKKAGFDPNAKMKDLTEAQIEKIREILASDYVVEGDLRKIVTQNIKKLIDSGAYRGTRHKRGMPVRGQRTRTNARTRKGPARTVGVQRAK